MKENQKLLYEHYKKMAKDYSGPKAELIKGNMKKYSEDILKSFPEFEEKSKPEPKDKIKEKK